MREVVTVQVGGFANFVGSHFWNFQDELLGLADDPGADAAFRTAPLDMDVLYRTGETLQGVSTYCPRLVSVGSRGSLGSLSSSGAPGLSSAASEQLNVTTWSGNVTRSVAKPHGQNLFLQSLTEQEPNPSTSNGGDNSQKSVEDKDLVECLEKDVNFWTDYTKVQYHPQSLYEMHGSWTDFDKFDNFGTAREVVSEWSLMEEMNEKLRFFVEECDHIQGIQFIVDDSGGFSSIAATYLENIADDYTNAPVLLYCVRDPVTHGSSRNQRETITRSLHDAVSFSKLSSFCSLMIPIGLPSLSQSYLSPFLSIQDAKPFHSSAISAAAIHSVTVPFRLQNAGPASNIAHSSGNIDMRELVHIISDQGRQNMVTALDVAMPAPSLKDGNDLWNMKSLHSLTPEISDEEEADPRHEAKQTGSTLSLHPSLSLSLSSTPTFSTLPSPPPPNQSTVAAGPGRAMLPQQNQAQAAAMMQQAAALQSMYAMPPPPHHHHLLGAAPPQQIEPILTGNLPPGFDTSTCRSVYVGNIHVQVTEALLREVFQSAGSVDGCKLIRKEKSSYGFVDYYERGSAALAILTLNGKQIFGQPIRVNWAYASGQREDTTDHFHIFVGDLSPEVTDSALFAFFSAYSPNCSDARVMWDQKTGRSRGYGFVSFRNQQDAQSAINDFNGQWLGNRQIRCNWATKGANSGEDQLTSDSKSMVDVNNNFTENAKQKSNEDAPENNPLYRTVYVGNLAHEVTQDVLHRFFHALGAGAIEEVRVQHGKGFGFVKYSNHAETALAIQTGNGRILGGKPVKCSWGNKPTPPGTTSAPLPPPAAPSHLAAADLAAYHRAIAMSKMASTQALMQAQHLRQAAMGMGVGVSQAMYDGTFQNVGASQQQQQQQQQQQLMYY